MAMQLMVEITSTETENRSGTGRTGKPYNIRSQTAYLHQPGKPYPLTMTITLKDSQPPYQPGNYDLAPESFYLNKYKSLAVNPVLVARPAEQPRKVS